MNHLPPATLALLACPACRGTLAITHPGDGQPSVSCGNCGRHYPVVDGIPVLIVERATR